MSQLRLNPLTGRWVTIALDRAERPDAFAPRELAVQADTGRPCPFCPGHEEATPPALETYGPHGTWLVRVVPNLYPAFAGDEPMAVRNLGPVFAEAPASGIHEVLVFSPDHGASVPAWRRTRNSAGVRRTRHSSSVVGRVVSSVAMPPRYVGPR